MRPETDDLIASALKKGSDSEYRAYVQRQPSCISGKFSEQLDSGEYRSIACHVRRSRDSGTAMKASYSCVPMDFVEHHLQHTQGEAALLHRHRLIPRPDRDLALAWFDEKRLEYLRMWIES